MKILVFEYFVAGGLWQFPASARDELLAQGQAMAASLASDLAAIPGVHARLAEGGLSRAAFQAQLAGWDAAVIIAPEFDGLLEQYAVWAEEAGVPLLSPGSRTIAIAGHKGRACQWLAQQNVRVPPGLELPRGACFPRDFPRPAVVKRCDGAGSYGLVRVPPVSVLHTPQSHGPVEHQRMHDRASELLQSADCRVEQQVPGEAASVAVLCGPRGVFPLAPCLQLLDDDFQYLGGAIITDTQKAHRARQLAARAVASLPESRGFLGVDLVLGLAEDGEQDTVIEINPRLTLSYCGLRQRAQGNLAAWMLDAAQGREICPQFNPEPLKFDAAGHTQERMHADH